MIYTNPQLVAVDWLGSGAIRVVFESEHTALHQLYSGRRLIGETTSTGQRVVEGPLAPTRWPQYLQVVAVTGSHRGVDNGSQLPPRPYNVVSIAFDQAGWSGDPHDIDVMAFDLFRGSEPDGAIDYGSIIATVLAVDVAGHTYEMRSDPLPGSGTWNIGVRGRDDSETGGNAGTAFEATVDVIALPPDFDDDYAVDVESSTLTVTCTLPERTT